MLPPSGRRTHGPDDGTLLVVASNAGADRHPHWYTNLQAEPRVLVRVGPVERPMTARAAGPDERPALWALVTAAAGTYEAYQARTAREIPVVVLTPEAG